MTAETKRVDTMWRGVGRRIRWVLILIGVGSFLWVYAILQDKILPIDRVDADRLDSVENAQRYFDKPAPTKQEIESYLSNATIVASNPPGGNAVYYFDAPHHFLKWHSSGTPVDDLLEGTWSLDWHVMPIELNGRWRFAIVYVLCTRSPDSLPADEPFCHDVRMLNPMLRFGLHQDYRVGNVFGLSVGGNIPFQLPTTKGISIDGLLALKERR